MATKDIYTRDWIIENSIDIVDGYVDGILTIRGLHYRLVARGMTNSFQHYKRVVTAMIKARWDGSITFEKFSDNDREMIGQTNCDQTDPESEARSIESSIRYWMTNYTKNRWENQPYFPEVFIEKKALQGVFGEPCSEMEVGLGACKGYPSLTFINDTAERYKIAIDQGKTPIILYFGDYDPSGEDIPRSLQENLSKLGVDVEVRTISLTEEQVVEWKLPPAPTKSGDTRSLKWDGLGQVELDAVEPEKLQSMCLDAIEEVFDRDLYSELLEEQALEKVIYMKQVKEYVNSLHTDDDE